MSKSRENAKGKTSRAGAARRCLELLETLAYEPYRFSLAQIAEMHSLPKSSAHRLLGLLMEAGLVEMEAASRRYALTPRVLWIGSSYLRGSALQRSAHVVMPQLSFQTGAMSHLGVWDGQSVLVLQSVDPPNTSSLFVEVGERRPAHATALGKALLAYRPAAALKEFCQGGLPLFTPNSISTRAALEEELRRVREAGYAVDNEEYALGLRCIAAPIRSQEGVIGALAISGGLDLIATEGIPRLAQSVQDAALRVSALMGYRPLSARIDLGKNSRTPSFRGRQIRGGDAQPAAESAGEPGTRVQRGRG